MPTAPDLAAPPRILVVEDDPAMAANVVRGLKAEGFEVELSVTGDAALERLLTERFAAVVLDLNLPQLDGLQILERVRHLSSTPLLVVSARTELVDRLRTFEAGAADYLAKPFWMEELVARLRRLLGRSAAAPTRVLEFDGLTLDLDAREARLGVEPVALTPNEWSLLAYLAARPGRAVSRAVLAHEALASPEEVDARTIDSHIAKVRRKLATQGTRIATVWGVGYRFDGGSE